MGEHRPDKVLVKAGFPQVDGGHLAVFVRVLFVVEIVEEAHHAPVFHIFAVKLGKVAHRRLHRDGVVDERFGVGVLLEQFKRSRPIHRKCHICSRPFSIKFPQNAILSV